MSADSHPGLTVAIPADAVDEVSWRLEQLGALALEERDGTTLSGGVAEHALLLAGFQSREARDAAVRDLNDHRRRSASRIGEVAAVDVTDDGWSSGWREFFHPVLLESIAVVTPWMEPPVDRPLTITIDPGLAFGTGGHATTRQVLTLLERAARDGGLPPRVLDVGTGSGVLAIAAALLGASEVRAIDIDPDSVAAAIDNARANGVADRIEATRHDPGSVEGQWPLVLANLELPLFERFGADLARLVRPGGTALISGLLVEQAADGARCWSGLTPFEQIDDEGWAALALRRPG